MNRMFFSMELNTVLRTTTTVNAIIGTMNNNRKSKGQLMMETGHITELSSCNYFRIGLNSPPQQSYQCKQQTLNTFNKGTYRSCALNRRHE